MGGTQTLPDGGTLELHGFCSVEPRRSRRACGITSLSSVSFDYAERPAPYPAASSESQDTALGHGPLSPLAACYPPASGCRIRGSVYRPRASACLPRHVRRDTERILRPE